MIYETNPYLNDGFDPASYRLHSRQNGGQRGAFRFYFANTCAGDCRAIGNAGIGEYRSGGKPQPCAGGIDCTYKCTAHGDAGPREHRPGGNGCTRQRGANRDVDTRKHCPSGHTRPCPSGNDCARKLRSGSGASF